MKNKEKLNIAVLICSACGELIPEHEKYAGMSLSELSDIECMSCEMKYWDSSDIDNFGS